MKRIISGLKRFQPILNAAKARDDGEADTVTIVTDMLAEIFGYDKYAEVTGQSAVRGTYCDLVIKLADGIQLVLEVKAIGLELKETHVKQAVDYAAHLGVDWAILTNGIVWRFYKVAFTKPIEYELILTLDILSISSKNQSELELLYLLCKEGWTKSLLGHYHSRQQALSRFFLAAMVTSEPLLDVLRRELRRLSPELKVGTTQIREILCSEVLKREVLEGDKAEEARKRISRSAAKAAKAKLARKRRDALQEDAVTSEDGSGSC